MNPITSKSGMSRLSLISFILLNSLFMIENAFSIRQWKRENLSLSYNRENRLITFDFLFYDYGGTHFEEFGYLKSSTFYFSDDYSYDNLLMAAETMEQKCINRTWIMMKNKKSNEKIQFLNCVKPQRVIIWPEDGNDLMVEVYVKKDQIKEGIHWKDIKRSYLRVMWLVSPSYKEIKTIRIKGNWVTATAKVGQVLDFTYDMKNFISNANRLTSTPSTLKSEISNNVKVTCETDAIIVTGAEPGENIKVYTTTGVVVKSVISNNEVLKVELPAKQIYFVHVGESQYKVAF